MGVRVSRRGPFFFPVKSGFSVLGHHIGIMMALFFALGRLLDVFGSWARSCFLREVSSILDRFRKGFGRVWGVRNGVKIDISGVLGGMCFETLFLSDVCKFVTMLIKSKAKNTWIFDCFF